MNDPRRLLQILALVLVLPAACSDDDTTAPPDGGTLLDGAPLPEGGAAPDGGADAARSAACLAQDKTLQAALDAARKSPNALLVVRNTACGTTVYHSGSSSSGSATALWRIGSVTKTYVAATILTLVRDKKLALSDPLSKWVPNVASTVGVTVKMLLNHTSGIFNYTNDPQVISNPLKEWKPAELVALAATHAPSFKPGAGWEYSNTNYILLGMIAEKAGGAKAAALIRKRALQPAGLSSTFLEGEETLKGTLATGYNKNQVQLTGQYSMSFAWTAGAMTASGADLCDWIHALLGTTKVLTAAEQKTMLTGVTASATTSYGLGVMLLDASITGGAGQGQGHGGDIFGYHTQAFWFPAKQTAICAVVNMDGTSPNDLTAAALTALF